MSAVTAQEIINALRESSIYAADQQCRQEIEDRIKAHGIAPPDGMVLVQTQDPAAFTEWLCREMPAGTIIGDAKWWAKRIASRFIPQAVAPKQDAAP